jgi:hypothetical protein
MPFYKVGRNKRGFEVGIAMALQGILVSPNVLFRIEGDPGTLARGSPYSVGRVDLASRLSFFLWSSMPDDELLDRAEGGKLKDPAVVEQRIRRTHQARITVGWQRLTLNYPKRNFNVQLEAI